MTESAFEDGRELSAGDFILQSRRKYLGSDLSLVVLHHKTIGAVGVATAFVDCGFGVRVKWASHYDIAAIFF